MAMDNKSKPAAPQEQSDVYETFIADSDKPTSVEDRDFFHIFQQNPQGIEIFNYLMKRFYMRPSFDPSNQYNTAYQEGQRSVITEIMYRCGNGKDNFSTKKVDLSKKNPRELTTMDIRREAIRRGAPLKEILNDEER